MKRASGILLPISALPGEYSIGSFGTAAYDFVDFLKKAGFSYWQILPFGMTDECFSPYKSCSAFGGEPYYIDLEVLYKEGLLTRTELESQRQKTPYYCETEWLDVSRMSILRRAAGRVEDRSAIEKWISAQPELEAFCRFMCLKMLNGGKPWYEWKNENIDEEELFFWQFTQWEFFTQWTRLKAYANANGINIIGDIPFYVDLDSCDVWQNREQFQLDGDNVPKSVAGVPPDYFSEDGQLWGNPLYNWEKMRDDGYSWWKARMKFLCSVLDGVRIDHFRAIESYYSIPGDAENARCGTWQPGPGMELINAIRSVSGDKLLIAEDLGVITPEVHALLQESGLPGMRVFQFAFLGDADSPHLPHNYINNCIAYTGTHDNNTLLGYLWELDDETRANMLDYCSHSDPDWGTGCMSIIRTMLSSSAGLVVMPMQDVLGFGSDTRVNTPGVAKGNWIYRVTRDQLAGAPAEKFAHLNRLYSRI